MPQTVQVTIDQLADDLLVGRLGPEDFHSVEMLQEIDDNLRSRSDDEDYRVSGVRLAKVRQAVIKRMGQLKLKTFLQEGDLND